MRAILYGLLTLLFTTVGIIIVKNSDCSLVFGILSFLVAAFMLSLTIREVLGKVQRNSNQSSNRKWALVISCCTALGFVVLAVLNIVNKEESLSTFGWIIAACFNIAYIIIMACNNGEN